MNRPLALVIGLLVVPLAATPASAGGTITEPYDMPSSFVIRDVFGFGVLVCADPTMDNALGDNVRNGPCLDYAGSENAFAVGSADDGFWSDTSVTFAIDTNGDGCVSSSCRGQPNNADVRVSNCGPVAFRLPEPDPGVPSIVQTYLRVIDINPGDLGVCGATSGDVVLTLG